MRLLEGKVALVTGGSRGIGAAIVRRYANAGAAVAFTYLSSAERANALVAELEALGVQAKAYSSDAADFSAADQLVSDVLADFGKIDICVNNAGISRDNLMLRVTPEQWAEVLHANLDSVFNLSKLVMKPMMKARTGSIINMSSIVGIQGNAGQASYAASKAGIIGLTKSIAREMGTRNIRCNAIAPGFIQTDMTDALHGGQSNDWISKIPLQRFGTPEEVADTALYLGSDMSKYVTGQVISVCGGMNI